MKKFLVLSAAVLMSGMVYAESVTCENENGKCEFFEDGTMTCECTDFGTGSSSVGTDPNGDEVVMPTTEECLAMVEEMCGIPEGAVTCENPAGNCIVYADGTYYCQCLDGTGEGTGGSSDPGDPGDTEVDPTEPPQTDGGDSTEPAMNCSDDKDCPVDYICDNGICEFNGEIEMPVCAEVLVDICGTEAPDLRKICSEESLPYCVNALSTLSGKCGEALPEETVNELLAGTWNDSALQVAECCRGYETEKTYYDDLTQCLETKACEECMGQFEEATGEDDVNEGGDTGDTGDTANTGNTGNTGDTGDTDASFEDDPVDKSTGDSSSTGCSIVNI
ncbi:MAG TPA: hypothetical protein PKG52_08750 [bacterium]|nr:hypothetical protein [bacterium]